jgi:hypothetical protein
METIQLPRHVIDRLENRWASRWQQDARAWGSDKPRSYYGLRHVQTDVGIIPIPVKRARRAAMPLGPHKAGKLKASKVHAGG